MGLFSLDIERLYDELAVKNQQLKGIFCLQYPIYCIHAKITDVTPDPLDNLDKAIVGFLMSKSNFTAFQLGSLMGTSKALIEMRLGKLVRDQLLVQNGKHYSLSDDAIDVFKNRTQIRQHKLSYDFYIDGLTLLPLPKVFYTYYRSKFISENDSYYRTNRKGETILVRPFGPDLVHTPPSKEDISNNIFSIDDGCRDKYNIPQGLITIDDISYTKMSFQILVSVSAEGDNIIKKVVDGFALYSLAENISYYETITRNVKSFEDNLADRIANLEFKIVIRPPRDKKDAEKILLTSNWPEIDKYKESKNKCFNFSSEDLVKVISQIFQINHVVPESIVNEVNAVAINISERMLLDSPHRQKLIGDLIRERDYKFGNAENNVFLLYLYYMTTDSFVQNIVDFKKTLGRYKLTEIDMNWVKEVHPEFLSNYRALLSAAGEFNLLEKLDIQAHMLQLR